MKYVFIVLAVALILTGCATTTQPTPATTTTTVEDVQTFESFADVQAYLHGQQQGNDGDVSMRAVSETMMFADEAMAPTAAPQSDGMVAGEVGGTNTQFAGVDEADFVKNDNRYLYILADNRLVIIDAADAPNAEEISETRLPEDVTARQLFVLDDQLIVIGTEQVRTVTVQKYDIVPQPRWYQQTVAYVYDIADRSEPVLQSNLTVSGNFIEARRVDGTMYLIAQESPWHGDVIIEPMIRSAGRPIPTDFIVFPTQESYVYTTVVSMDIPTREVLDSETYLMGYGTTVMMNEDSLYLAYQKPRTWNHNYDEERFYDVILPRLDDELKQQIEPITRMRITEEEQWKRIQAILTDYFEDIQARDEAGEDLEEYEEMMEDIQDALDEYDRKRQLEEQMTTIHSIDLENGLLSYNTQGEVPGRLLNQFSMDEHEDNLRIATTISLWGRESTVFNNIYILDDELERIGSVENIAEDETIHSVRFIGDTAYMVTFRQIDPFFVIDLENPRAPEVLGEVKLAGYSAYLHPISDDLIIGIGMDTEENEWGGVSEAGVKLALFDVSDPGKPLVIDEVTIGGRGSSTPVRNDHKAFRYIEDEGIIVLPVRVSDGWNEGTTVRDRAYVYHVDETGLDREGFVQHGTSSDWYSWREGSTVLRSTYFDDYLYTISQKYVKANEMDGLEEVTTIELPYSSQHRGYPEMLW